MSSYQRLWWINFLENVNTEFLTTPDELACDSFCLDTLIPTINQNDFEVANAIHDDLRDLDHAINDPDIDVSNFFCLEFSFS